MSKDFRFIKQYLIIGSNNFWYASCLRSMKEVNDEIKVIQQEPYAYQAKEIKQIELDEEEE